MPTAVSFDEVLAEAVAYFVTHGFQEPDQLSYWAHRLGIAARREMISTTRLKEKLRASLTAEYTRQVDKGLILKVHPDLTRETLTRLRPQLRQVLNTRIAAANALITLNREEEVASVIRRFAGWASSLPPVPAPATDRREARSNIRKSLFEANNRERMLIIDQGHKLNNNISSTLAEGGGAIAAYWISHYQQHNYDYREVHKDLAIQSQYRPFLIRDSWAHRQGLLNTVGATFTDQLEYQPGQQPYCRCYFQYIYNPRKLPPEMLTARAA